MVLFSVLVTAAFAVVIAGVCDNMAVGIGLFVGALRAMDENTPPSKKRKELWLSTALLVLIGYRWLNNRSEEE